MNDFNSFKLNYLIKRELHPFPPRKLSNGLLTLGVESERKTKKYVMITESSKSNQFVTTNIASDFKNMISN